MRYRRLGRKTTIAVRSRLVFESSSVPFDVLRRQRGQRERERVSEDSDASKRGGEGRRVGDVRRVREVDPPRQQYRTLLHWMRERSTLISSVGRKNKKPKHEPKLTFPHAFSPWMAIVLHFPSRASGHSTQGNPRSVLGKDGDFHLSEVGASSSRNRLVYSAEGRPTSFHLSIFGGVQRVSGSHRTPVSLSCPSQRSTKFRSPSFRAQIISSSSLERSQRSVVTIPSRPST